MESALPARKDKVEDDTMKLQPTKTQTTFRTLAAFATCLFALPASASTTQDQKGKSTDQKPAQEKKGDAKRKLLELFKKQGISLDAKSSQIWVGGKVNITRDFLEFVAIGPRGKKHESLIMLNCLGSTLNTALALLKLKPGKNVDYKPVVPLPTREEVEKGAPTAIVIPPSGPRVYLALRWTTKDGKQKTVAIEDLILDVRKDAPLRDAEWIYFGGRMARLYKGEPPVYMADYEQNYISTYYAKPDNQLITIRHKMGNYDDNWWPNERLLPERGAKVELGISTKPIVKRLPTKESYPDAWKRKPAAKPAAGGQDPESSGVDKKDADKKDAGKKAKKRS